VTVVLIVIGGLLLAAMIGISCCGAVTRLPAAPTPPF
jgi:hypothetical protein